MFLAHTSSATAKDMHVGTTKRSRTYPVLFKSGLGDIKRISASAAWVPACYVEPVNAAWLRTGEHRAREETEARVKVCTHYIQKADVADQNPLAECICRLAFLLVTHIDIPLELFKARVT